jgi:hypothetical protein
LLQIGIESGIVGLAILGIVLAGLVCASLNVRRDTTGVFASAIFVIIGVQSLVDWTLSIPLISVMFALVAGVVLGRADRSSGVQIRFSSVQRVLKWTRSRQSLDAGLTAVATGVLLLLAALPIATAQLTSYADDQLDSGHNRRAQQIAGISWALLPTSRSFVTRLLAFELDGDVRDAQEFASIALSHNGYDRVVCAAVRDAASNWNNPELSQRAESCLDRVDTARWPASAAGGGS